MGSDAQAKNELHLPEEVLSLPVAEGRNPDRLFMSREQRRDIRALLSIEMWQWYIALFGWIPGRAGSVLRGLAYRPFLKRAGRPVFFGEHVRITSPENLDIGDWGAAGHYTFLNATGGIKIGAWAAVTHRCILNTVNHVYEDPEAPVRLQGLEVAPIVVEDDAWLGSGVYVMPGVTIGRGAIVGANSVVTRDIPAYSIAAGIPARPIRRRRLPGEAPTSRQADRSNTKDPYAL